MNKKRLLLKMLFLLKKVLFLYELILIKKLKKQRRNPQAMEALIRIIAKQEGVDPDLAVRVAKCESNLNPDAVRQNFNGSIDRGLYQWNDYWHPEITDEIAFDPEKATRAFCRAVKSGHLNWWYASENCWRK